MAAIVEANRAEINPVSRETSSLTNVIRRQHSVHTVHKITNHKNQCRIWQASNGNGWMHIFCLRALPSFIQAIIIKECIWCIEIELYVIFSANL